ncbi:MAG TPA: SH3 domain-containing protein [Devosia sp.]|nr:SH3 domain-containing protein [Devosia sp.]
MSIAFGTMGFDRDAPTNVRRYVSLARANVNMREGPSFDHKIRWVYHREGLPVLILSQFDVWRRVQDSDGAVGWIQSSMLSAARTVVVKGKKPAPLRDAKRKDAHVSAYMAPGVVARVQSCTTEFCTIVTAGAVGWINKKFIWGVDPGETF